MRLIRAACQSKSSASQSSDNVDRLRRWQSDGVVERRIRCWARSGAQRVVTAAIRAELPTT